MNLLYKLSCLLILVCLSCSPVDSTVSSAKDLIADREYIPHPDRYNVAFLIMDGVYNTELTAPYS